VNAHEVFRKIMDETHIVRSALEARDMLIVTNALKERERWIEDFKKFDIHGDAEIESKILEFNRLNDICMKELKVFENEMEEEHYVNKAERKQAHYGHKAQNSYMLMNARVGRTFDKRK